MRVALKSSANALNANKVINLNQVADMIQKFSRRDVLQDG